ncbi:hypothetical protein [Hyalangium versicolor]|uniref:hypothetical protein n=1 Tax=Hyalangium versicolor TaxID=2861190 RepID=UPI001CCAB319|nr:hypothetical protein [Hyalangium versicolor]
MSTPLSFVRAWSEHRGAVVEAGQEGVEILQPAELATALGLPEHARYAEQPTPGALWVGYGAPTLERFLQEATRHVPWAALTLEPHSAPREATARAAAERFVLRNAVHELEGSRLSTGARLVAYVRYSLSTDDRRDGLVEETVSVSQRVSVPGFWRAAGGSGALRPAVARPAGAALEQAARAALLRAEASARAQSRAFLEGSARRQERDLRRMEEYFHGLRAELDKRARRGKLAAEDIALKAGAIERERAGKLQELKERGQVRYEAALVAAVWLEAPVAELTLRARRRKAECSLTLEYDFVTLHLLAPVCAACGLDAPQPALCDERLHVLCVACVPRAEGRWSCPACREPRADRGE